AKKVGINPKRARLLNRLIRYLKIENVLELGTSLGISTAAMAIGNDVKITTVEGCPETAKVAQENFDAFNLNNIELKIGEFGVLLNDILEGRKKSEEKRDENRKKRKENKEIPNPPAGRAGPESPINEQQTTTDQKSQNPNSKSHPEISGPNPQLTNPESRINKHQTFDLIFFDGNHKREATLSYFEKLLPLAHNDSVFIFDDIHWSEGMEEAWKEICAHPKVKVSIDTFQWGLVFFRKEQKKQHFVIRL
ncbi:MAG TPA: class I SAM-dependent methyltransferase, partial [Salinimicrobium sp.]|nr:class I SAM-dependent methyltransferase [Salinimicrobium sp.]